ncbi:MerC domain-containing protein [Sphingorhabdus sp.]|uniref:MerC domain-containing protein n=1 Tax=Sphingorhabdus sp. TaxID=1902408 RepID=UPI003D8191C8
MKTISKNWLDGMALGASGLCLLHCLALPMAIALLPAAAVLGNTTEQLHIWILATAVPTSLFALVTGARQSGQIIALITGFAALLLLVAGLLLEEVTSMAVVVTVLGSVLLAYSHITNWRMRNGAAAKR